MINNLKSNIQRIFVDKNISSVSAFEAEAGFRSCAVRNILTGRSKSPSFTLIYKIAQELDCSVEDLIKDPQKKEEKSNASKVWSLDVLEGVYASVFRELNKYTSKIDKKTFIDIIGEVYNYTLKLPDCKISEEFTSWLVERFMAKR